MCLDSFGWDTFQNDEPSNKLTAPCYRVILAKHAVSSATQEIFCIIRNTNVHYIGHSSPEITLILSQINKFHIWVAYLTNIYFNITLPSTARSSNKSSSFTFHHRNPLRHLLTPHKCSSFIPPILIPAI